jgi:hypothetical protein
VRYSLVAIAKQKSKSPQFQPTRPGILSFCTGSFTTRHTHFIFTILAILKFFEEFKLQAYISSQEGLS